MAKAEAKTKPTTARAEDFIAGVADATRREDALIVLELMKRVTGLKPVMWGPSLVGFGSYHFRYESGREGDFFLIGFSPRKAELVLYIMPGFAAYEALLARLGKYKTGKSCLYVKKLADIDMSVLEELMRQSFAHMKAKAR